jgi:membrane protein DedA with SNARE-associated domain
MSVRTVLALLPFSIGVIVSITFFFFIDANSIVDYIGTQNAYLMMYTMATLGGLTTFNTIPYFSIILVLATAGVNPVFLGLSSALGVMTGDSFSYLTGRQGATLIPGRLHRLFTNIHELATRHPKTFPIVCFVYGCVSPLSNDFITIPAGMAKIPYWRVMGPLGIGNIIFNITFAYLSVYAYDWVQTVFVG